MKMVKSPENFPGEKKNYNIIFCLASSQTEHADVNGVNECLEKMQICLKGMADKGQKVEKAFVFGDQKASVRTFQNTKVQKIYYADYGDRIIQPFRTVLIGLILLESQKEQSADSENILCLIMNDSMGRVESDKIIRLMKGFEDMSYIPVLIKAEHVPTAALEEYIGRNGYVYSMKDV